MWKRYCVVQSRGGVGGLGEIGVAVGEGGHDCVGFVEVLAIQLDIGGGWHGDQ